MNSSGRFSEKALTLSPLPEIVISPPVRNNGTSEPSSRASSSNCCLGIEGAINWSSAHKTAAASLDPPPSPAPVGMFFSTTILTPFVFLSASTRFAACQTRSSSRGIARLFSTARVRPINSIVIVSARSIV